MKKHPSAARAGLRSLGPAQAFLRVRSAGFRPALNLLYALDAALRDTHWTLIPPKRRDELCAAVNEPGR